MSKTGREKTGFVSHTENESSESFDQMFAKNWSLLVYFWMTQITTQAMGTITAKAIPAVIPA